MSETCTTQADHVITKLGGVPAVARLLGHRNVTTVQGWKERGFIPPRRQAEVLEAARRAGVDLSPDDFVVHLATH